MTYLYGGKILHINLTDHSFRFESTEDYKDFFGGKGINLKLLFDAVDGKTDPFDPENVLLFGVGPLAATPFPGACRMDIMAKSPVTGYYGDSGMGGYLGPELKFAGIDNLAIEGQADKPIYVYIDGNQVKFCNAEEIWGKDAYETPNLIRDKICDPKAQVVCIGPAGEKKVVYATIMSGTGNAAARTGMGAVMGSKNLKAIAVRGRKGIHIARPIEFIMQCRKLFESIQQARYYAEIHKIGLTRIHDKEMRSAHYLLGTNWPEGETIRETEFIEKHLHRRVGCFSCPLVCFDGYKIPGSGSGSAKCSPYGDLSWDLRNSDLMVFWESYLICQRYGIDARSVSNIIAWLMVLYERGIINKSDADGLCLEWGNPEAIIKLTKKISSREGIGDLMADGLPRAAEKIGKGSSDYLLLSKGSPSDMHIVPLKVAALASAVSPIGEDAQIQSFISNAAVEKYLQSKDEESFQAAIKKYKDRMQEELGSPDSVDPRIIKGKAAIVRQQEIFTNILDMTGVCSWLTGFTGLPVNVDLIAHLLSLGFGKDVSPDQLKEYAEKMHLLERSFLCKCGLNRSYDVLSKAYFGKVKPGGKEMPELNFTTEELEMMKDDYYLLSGWHLESGMPTRSALERYGLKDIADKLGIDL